MGSTIRHRIVEDDYIEIIHRIPVKEFFFPNSLLGRNREQLQIQRWLDSEEGIFCTQKSVSKLEFKRTHDFEKNITLQIIAEFDEKTLTEYYLKWSKNDRSF